MIKKLWVPLALFLGLAMGSSLARANSYFRVQKKAANSFALVNPEGKEFYSFGVNHITSRGDASKNDPNRFPYRENWAQNHSSDQAWARATSDRLHSWGFNTIALWSEFHLFPGWPYTLSMECASGFGGGRLANQDLWEPSFAAYAQAQALRITKGRTQDKNLIGYFLDNELPWGRDHREFKTLLEVYMSLPATAPGKKVLIQFLRSRYNNNIWALNQKWRSFFRSFEQLAQHKGLPPVSSLFGNLKDDELGFLGLTADHYFKTCSDALRQEDPNHLLLGARLIGLLTFPPVLEAAGKTQDVVSVNLYSYLPGIEKYLPRFLRQSVVPAGGGLIEFYKLTKKPILLSEFGERAWTPLTPSTWPPLYPTHPNQFLRARAIRDFLDIHSRQPFILGFHLFQYSDQPAEGRFDGENNNWGLVDIYDRPYVELTRATREFMDSRVSP